jgi:hypothetical protein
LSDTFLSIRSHTFFNNLLKKQVKMKKEQQNLWLKVARFPLNDPDAAYPFSQKLAHTQKWSEDKTMQVIAEYKKFMFLCMTAPNGASPSEAVDECWHLHLTFTANYAAFCQETAGKFIHHNPSKGGTTEHHRHIDWYEDTLKNYVDTFQQIPPSGLWPTPEGFEPTDYLSKSSPMHPLSIAPFLATNWQELNDNSAEFYVCASVILGILATIPFVGNLFSMNGDHFLGYFGSLLIALIIFKICFRTLFDRRMRVRVEMLHAAGLSAYQTAFWMGGGNRVLQTAALELMDKSILKKMDAPNPDKFLLLDKSADFDADLLHNPFYLTLQTVEKQTITPNFLKLSIVPTNTVLAHDADRLNITAFPTDINAALAYLFFALGFCRIMQGAYNHKPVGFLVGLIGVYALVHFLWPFSRKSIQGIIDYIFKQNNDKSLIFDYATRGRDALATASMTDISLSLALIATDWHAPNNRLGNEGSNSFVCGGAVVASSSGGDGGGGCGSDGGGGCSGGGGCGGGCGGCGGCGS